MKVIFLDIDGVMNSNIFYEKRHRKQWFDRMIKYPIKRFFMKIMKSTSVYKTPKGWYTFDSQFNRLLEETCKEKCVWLSQFCNENDIKICISSTWKRHFGSKDEVDETLCDKALTLLGFKENTFVGITGDRRQLRGTEIKEWLDINPVDDYVILDDDSDMLPNQFCKFHQCDSWFGLTPNHLYRINRQFNVNFDRIGNNILNDYTLKILNSEFDERLNFLKNEDNKNHERINEITLCIVHIQNHRLSIINNK